VQFSAARKKSRETRDKNSVTERWTRRPEDYGCSTDYTALHRYLLAFCKATEVYFRVRMFWDPPVRLGATHIALTDRPTACVQYALHSHRNQTARPRDSHRLLPPPVGLITAWDFILPAGPIWAFVDRKWGIDYKLASDRKWKETGLTEDTKDVSLWCVLMTQAVLVARRDRRVGCLFVCLFVNEQ
jgi:hypothetical protein